MTPSTSVPEVPPQYLMSRSAPSPRTLVDVIGETAARYPDAVAIDDGTVRLTYAELIDELKCRVALLADHGVGHGDRIGIRMPSGNAALYATILGVLFAGAAYVPVDADDPDERVERVFREANVAAVITADGITGGPGSSGDPVRAPSVPSITDDAWVIFTSGSTGTPKGVAVTHRSAAAFVDAEAQMFQQDDPIRPCDRVMAGLSVTFDASCEEMWLAWRHGACLVPAPRSLVRSGMDLGSWLVAREITVISTVPTLAAMWPAEALGAVRLLIFGGEACPPELATRLATDSREVWNTYGPTEATVVACGARLDGVGAVSIGLPLAGWDLAVVDLDGVPVGYGAIGELVIGGVGLARYLDPAKDAEKYGPIPLLKPTGAWDRAYRSGDLVRLEPDGLYFHGRVDDQVKVGGRRIELGEIDAALTNLPGVSGGAAAVRRTVNDTPLLVGYVASTDPVFDLAKARTLLVERLPSAMVPRLVRIDELPTRVSGKVDRDALPWPPPEGYGHADVRDDIVVPRDEIEAALAKIWCETLGVEAVSVTDDVFDLGADSLLTARISILARGAGYALTPRDLVENPTLEALARRAGAARPTAINLQVPDGDTPLSPMQRYYFSWATPNPNKFNVGFIAQLATPLDPELLQRAFRVVIEHHPALRLRFRRDADGGFLQRHESVDVSSQVPIQRIQLPEGSDDGRAAFIEGEMERLNDSLDICDGPTIAVGLFEQGPGKESRHDQYFFAMHQLISDAVSLDIVLEDLRTAYTALAAGRDPVLPAQTMLFHQWVDHLIDYARGPAAAQWDYWLDQMRDAHGFPEDDVSAVALQRDVAMLEFEVLSASEVDEVRAPCGGSFHATLIHATVAALALTAHRISGQRNLVLHKTAHGRETCIPGADVSRTVGWFVTHTPITVRLPDGPLDDIRVLPGVLEHVTEQYRAIPDNGLGHSALRYFSDDPRAVELARLDKVKTLFNYVGDVWESGYDGTMFVPPTATALMDIPDAAAAENLADYHEHVYAYLRDGAFRIDLFYTRPNHLPDNISRIAVLLTEQIRGMLLRR